MPIVDLSHVIADGTITYPGLPGPAISDHLSREASHQRYAPGYEFQIGRIDMVSNTGTYLDTPFHRFADGHDLAGLDPARVADVPGVLVDGTAGQEVGGAVLTGLDLAGRAVLVHTGWDRHWGTDAYGDAERHPYLGVDAAEALVAAGAAVVGIDSVNIDGTRTGERPIHTALLTAGIPIVEHLRGLDALAGRSFRFFAVPPAVAGMGTFPVRALAIVDG
jgi:kynurenine formamidase